MADRLSVDNAGNPPLVPGETRIRDVDGFVGTVAYIGPVASARNSEEIYAGITWDDATRGKHDGSVFCRKTNEVVRHFRCGPTQGSFMKLNKVDRGVTLTTELLRTKYVEMQAPVIAPNNILPHTARTSSGKDKPIEFLGELKIRQRQQLEDIHKVSLRWGGISRVDDALSKQDSVLVQNIQDVDLAGNLLSNWTEVLKIIKQFPNLTDLSVAFNRIQDVRLEVLQPPLTWIQVLNLNHCGLKSFESVVWVAKSMPSIESLCIASCDISDIGEYPTIEGLLLKLKMLDCSDCCLSSWENQIESHFGGLPSLEQLSLDGNPISSVHCSKNDTFHSMKYLQLAGTQLSTWMDLEGVNQLNLQALRLKNTPLTSTLGQGEIRFMCVARIPTLLHLNGSAVSVQERTEAERRYVTMVARLLMRKATALSPNTDNDLSKERFLREHPQYNILMEKHKDLVIPSANGSSNNPDNFNSSLASSICNVTITSMAASSCHMKPLTRKLPGTLTVGKLKALCARAFVIDIDMISLYFRAASDAVPDELDIDENTLAYYGVCDSAEIFMHEIDAEAQRRDAERLAKEQDQRILQQEFEVLAMQELKQRNHNGR